MTTPTPQQVLSDEEILTHSLVGSFPTSDDMLEFGREVEQAILAKLQAAPQAELSKESRTINGHMQHAIKLASRIDGADELSYALSKVAEHIDRLTVELGVLAMKGPQTIQAAPQAQASVERAIGDLIQACHRDGKDGKTAATPASLAALDALRLAIAQQPAHGAGEVVARSMDTAPRDGTIIRLLVQFEDHPLEDDNTKPLWTIGGNSLENTGEDLWQFAGWCWTHDRFTDGVGTPVGWLPLVEDTHPAPSPEAVPGPTDSELLDWLGANPSCTITEDSGLWFFEGHDYVNLRDAIRAALSTQQAQRKGGAV